jgi:hypothetical protein
VTAFLRFILGFTALTAVWVSLVVVIMVVAAVDKPTIVKKLMRILPKIR